MNLIHKIFSKHKNNKLKSQTIVRTYGFSLLFVSILISAAVLAIGRGGKLQIVELLAYDWMVELNSNEETDSRILVVEITDKDIERENKWPISDKTIAQVLKNLQKHQPKTIGLDLYRDVLQPPGSKALTEQLQVSNVVSIQYIGNGNNRISPPKGVSESQIGFNDVAIDADNVLRRNLMYVRLGDRELYSFSLRLSLQYLKERNLKFTTNDRSLQIGDAVCHTRTKMQKR